MVRGVKERCVIITAFLQGSIPNFLQFTEEDYIICADGGYHLAIAEGIHPHLLIGDFDSANSEGFFKCPVLQASAEKDETDTLLCLRHGIDIGYKHFVIVGGIGGRFDHTLANVQMLSYFMDCMTEETDPYSIWMLDEQHHITIIENSSITINKKEFIHSSKTVKQKLYFSIFSLTEECNGITITGAKYPLENATLNSSFPLGVSNTFLEDQVQISCTKGKLLIMIVKEKK